MSRLIISEHLHSRVVEPALLAELRMAFEAVPAVSGALLMGSRSRGVAHAKSNVDVQLVVDELDNATAAALARQRHRLEASLGVDISLNVHTTGCANPSLSKYDLFVHKNRADVFVCQAKYTGVLICGRNVFAEFDDPPPTRLRREAIRTVASFAYQLRKCLFDHSMAPHGAAEFVRTPLISLEYIAAFYGYISLGFRDGLDYLDRHGRLNANEVDFLKECAYRKLNSAYSGIDTEFVLHGIRFLDAVHARLLDEYRRLGVSDVRWDGTVCAVSWDLGLPQAAAMTILRADDQVLMLRRPADDYLYPNSWTVPGGYLQADEHPADGAAREVWEEVGTRLPVNELFGGQPVVSPRLAAFTFEARLSATSPPRLTEHDRYRFVSLADVPSMSLTPEARTIFERYREVLPL